MKVCFNCWNYGAPKLEGDNYPGKITVDDYLSYGLEKYYDEVQQKFIENDNCPICGNDCLVELDEDIAIEVMYLNKYNCKTDWCCSGHPHNHYTSFYIVTSNYCDEMNKALDEINKEYSDVFFEDDLLAYKLNPTICNDKCWYLEFSINVHVSLYESMKKTNVYNIKNMGKEFHLDYMSKRREYIHKVLHRTIELLCKEEK